MCVARAFGQLGGLFHPGDENQQIAFRYAIDKVNEDPALLPLSKLQAVAETISPFDSFRASKKGTHIIWSSARSNYLHGELLYVYVDAFV